MGTPDRWAGRVAPWLVFELWLGLVEGNDEGEPERISSLCKIGEHVRRSEDAKPEIVAHYIWGDTPPVCAPVTRKWMDETADRFAYRCLPLVIANQAGWVIENDESFKAIWDGGTDPAAIRIRQLDGKSPSRMVRSHFGAGVLTWHIPYLFRMSAGYNLLVRGPANYPKDGVHALEGIVETDWTYATFTMNWKFTRKRRWVTFDKGEPICMLVPQRRGELESFRTGLRALKGDPELSEGHRKWHESRSKFLVVSKLRGSAAYEQQWQRHYLQGRSPGEESQRHEHQTQLSLRPFEAEESE